MNTFLKIALGFVLGVVSTIGVLYTIGATQNTDENEQTFELTTKNGIVKLHTSISKDSVQILMGRPQATDVSKGYNGDIMETWKYKGTNSYVEEFTIEFTNGKLESVRQFKDH